MKLLMLTRGPFIESPTPPCTTRMTHFNSARGQNCLRLVRHTGGCLRCSPSPLCLFGRIQLRNPKKKKNHSWSFLKNTLQCCSVWTFMIFTSITFTQEGFCLCVRKIHIYIPGNICFPLGRVRLLLNQEGEGPHNFYFPLIALSWPQLVCILSQQHLPSVYFYFHSVFHRSTAEQTNAAALILCMEKLLVGQKCV